MRAAQTHLSTRFDGHHLYDVAPDWGDDDDEAVDFEVFPEPVPGYGYLLDATSRRLSAGIAQKLTSWADALHRAGSCLVITANPRDWQGDSRLEIAAVRPNAVRVAYNHLAARLGSPVHAQWLQPDPGQSVTRSFLRGAAADTTIGFFSDLITPSVSPADAVAIAERLYHIKPERLSAAVEGRQDRQTSSVQEQSHKEIEAIREEVLLWTKFLETKLVEIGTRGQDRLMLLSACYLEGAPLELCIKAATEFGSREEATARRYREGRSPRRRMLDVGVDITADDTASFHSRPGLSRAAIRMDWHHWTTERKETQNWLKRITAPGGVAEAWAEQVGRRLLDLSLSAVDPPFFSVLEEWTTAASSGTGRIRIIADLLTEASQKDEIAREAHSRLLDWARKTQSHREVVALVCRGAYGQRWPHRALVRLRHVLAHDDYAAQIATNALVDYAAGNEAGFNRVIDAVDTWFDKYPKHTAGPRAFLALVDPTPSVDILTTLISLAGRSPKIRDFLITGWQKSLEQPEVSEQAYQVLLAWAQSIHQEQLDPAFTFGLLTDVRNAHTPVDAMSRFLYGSPSHEDKALIDARLALANLRACRHAQCHQPDCPLSQHQSSAEGGPVADTYDAGE
ncbi:hypothetical protein [Streptomyces xinghaiensis]|uniref:hypothetical protein n=1 Tax=Streptomyces xinghaiensis TaxID=1038928 RepID=UPI0012FFB7D5|nr:hypothetical protein [Streptomyces xinghaiensis]MZE79354.1 hypothetical protein [Streptomyces sp. SID5475]